MALLLLASPGKRVASYSDIPREHRTGYEWYGDWPQSLLDQEYPKWKEGLTHD